MEGVMFHAGLLRDLGVTNPMEFSALPDDVVWGAVLAWQADPRRRGPGLLVWMLRHAGATDSAPRVDTAAAMIGRARELAVEALGAADDPRLDRLVLALVSVGRRQGPEAMQARCRQIASGGLRAA